MLGRLFRKSQSQTLEANRVSDSTQLLQQFKTGVFTTEESGTVQIDYLFDGTQQTGELGIFSLQGMEQLDIDSPEFIREAAQRVMNDSPLGQIAIQPQTQKAKFQGILGEKDSQPSETQNHPERTTLQMNGNDAVAFLFVPQGGIKKLLEIPDAPEFQGSNRPRLSLTPQTLADVGDGETFALETSAQKRTYNDLVFRIKGATPTTNLPSLDTVIDPQNDWRETRLGQAILKDSPTSLNEANTQSLTSTTKINLDLLLGSPQKISTEAENSVESEELSSCSKD
ncbi:MAG: hypothetical protein F6K03_16160 [Kamptonema sp. SIO4C4]|nr:hypothetical protein [Kamptonema sp. SIO4C4]